MKLKKTVRGFTLVELLVVIAIIAILAAVVVLIINPLELTKRGRDAARLTDLANLQQAINVAVQEATGSGTAEILCVGGTGGVCTGVTYPVVTDTRKADGKGWVKVNLSAQNAVSVPTLPADPTNSIAYHYTYCSNGTSWEINAVLESVQQRDKMANDGGPSVSDNAIDSTGRYEVGSDLSLIQESGGPCTY